MELQTTFLEFGGIDMGRKWLIRFFVETTWTKKAPSLLTIP